jgi:hypothetical protein
MKRPASNFERKHFNGIKLDLNKQTIFLFSGKACLSFDLIK